MPEVEALLRKAEDSLDAGQVLLERGHHDFSVSRSYYAMFYVAEALLLTKGLSFSKHSAVIAAFGQHFVKTGDFDPKVHRYLKDAFRARQLGDYEIGEAITEEMAAEILQ